MATLGGLQDVQGNSNNLEIESLARFAVDDHNKKQNANANAKPLHFVKVVKAKQQVVAGTIYFITLEVKEGAGAGAETKKYEAKVWEKSWLNFKEVQEFKPINEDAPSA